jgi:hypothetical protein
MRLIAGQTLPENSNEDTIGDCNHKVGTASAKGVNDENCRFNSEKCKTNEN